MSEILRDFRKKSPREKAATLVVTLLVMVLLSTIAVTFMQAVSMERGASRSIANRYHAELAAEAGINDARALVADLLARYPDSITVWQNIGGGIPSGTENEATVLYVRALSSNSSTGARPAQFGSDIQFLGRPLISLTNRSMMFPFANLASALPPNPISTVNLNGLNAGQSTRFIGSRTSTNAGAPITAAEWIYITNSAGATNARYAYWVEDESFKVNLNTASSGARGSTSPGVSPSEARLEGSWSSSTNQNLAGEANSIVTNRINLPGGVYPTLATARIPGVLSNSTEADEFNFLTTAQSAGLDLSRGGFKRFNINGITDEIASPTDVGTIRTNLSRVITAITNRASIPNFGQRFYRMSTDEAGVNATNAVTPEHSRIYLNKIAANLLDYIDSNSQPTVINNDSQFSIRAGKPSEASAALGGGLEGPNSLAAIGVENVPFLYGYAVHARLIDMNPRGFNSTNAPPVANRRANFEFTVDHYLEFWNMGTRPIRFTNNTSNLDPGIDYIFRPFLSVANAPGWGTSGAGQVDNNMDRFNRGGRDFEVDLPISDPNDPNKPLEIPAGGSVLFTTAPQQEAEEVAPSASKIIPLNLPNDKRRFIGQTSYVVNANNAELNFDRLYAIRRVHSTRQGNALDSETEILLGNEMGILNSFPYATVNTRNLMVQNSTVLNSAENFIDRSRLRGNRPGANNSAPSPNNPRSQEGDPRTINEQLTLIPYLVGSPPDQSRFFTDSDNTVIGRANTPWVDSAAWMDPSSMLAGALNAPLFITNSQLRSIGELGHIIDPARVRGTNVNMTNVEYSRGGGRTLRIGQPEHANWYGGNQSSASRTWTSWRLADIFTTKNLGTNLSIPGLINPNGFLRDRGAALRAALHGIRMLPSPEGSPNVGNSEVILTNVVNSVASRMAGIAGTGLPSGAVNAFWERGELSELPIWNSGSQLTGANMAQAFDRGREEIVRRTIEMVTTRGSVFTVYAVGQSMQGNTVTSTARIKQTFQVEPQFQLTANSTNSTTNQIPGHLNDRFDPTNAISIDLRFSPPVRYTTKALQTFHD